jgi:prevent-host-death family protein
MMKTLDVTKMRSELSETLNQVAYRGTRVLIERRGKPLAVLVPVEDLQLIELMEDQVDLDLARQALADPTNDTVPWEKVKERLGL